MQVRVRIRHQPQHSLETEEISLEVCGVQVSVHLILGDPSGRLFLHPGKEEQLGWDDPSQPLSPTQPVPHCPPVGQGRGSEKQNLKM